MHMNADGTHLEGVQLQAIWALEEQEMTRWPAHVDAAFVVDLVIAILPSVVASRNSGSDFDA